MEISKNYLDKYFGQKDLNIIGEIGPAITEKIFTLRHIGDINNRVIHNWILEGLVPGFKVTAKKKKEIKTGKKPQKWNRYSFLDYIWLRIMIELRKFDVSFALLNKIMDCLFTVIPMEDYIGLMKKNIGQFEKMLRPEDMDEFHATLADPKKDLDFMDVHSKMNFLFFLLCDVIIHKEKISLIIDNQGNVHPYSIAYAEQLMDDKEYFEAVSGHHISISLVKIVSEFISNSEDLNNDVLRLNLLTKQEIKIINLSRKETIKSMTVRYDEKSKPVIVELKSKIKVSPETKILDIIYRDGYHSIWVETAAGKVVYCTNTRKIKL